MKKGKTQQVKRPIYEMLEAAAKAQSAHMPGHKGRAPFGVTDLYRLDITELPSTDDLYVPERELRRQSGSMPRLPEQGQPCCCTMAPRRAFM